jgi:hypothetical protein
VHISGTTSYIHFPRFFVYMYHRNRFSVCGMSFIRVRDMGKENKNSFGREFSGSLGDQRGVDNVGSIGFLSGSAHRLCRCPRSSRRCRRRQTQAQVVCVVL